MTNTVGLRPVTETIQNQMINNIIFTPHGYCDCCPFQGKVYAVFVLFIMLHPLFVDLLCLFLVFVGRSLCHLHVVFLSCASLCLCVLLFGFGLWIYVPVNNLKEENYHIKYFMIYLHAGINLSTPGSVILYE